MGNKQPAFVGDTCPICLKQEATTEQEHSLDNNGVIACCEDCAFWLSQWIVGFHYSYDLEWSHKLDSKKNMRRLNEIMNSQWWEAEQERKRRQLEY